jgi:2,3-bisphosphoglycerate-dependent phosphoglycerate mutase
MPAIHVTFLRHGRSLADDQGVYEGRYDSPLTETGRSQIRACAQKWQGKSFSFDAIVSSPLLRAKESAEIVGTVYGLKVELDPDWLEIDHGPLAGMDKLLANKMYPLPDFRNPYQPIAGSGETDWDVHIRAARAVQKVIQRGPGNILVVAHGGIINSALRCIVGASPPTNRYGVYFSFNDAGYARLTYLPESAIWRLHELNSAD